MRLRPINLYLRNFAMTTDQTALKKGGFTFKRFFVAHDNSPMKVTTDSCLLGAWTPLEPMPKKVLDIGCGCGVIALMLAQRLAGIDCQIDAIDIDEQAVNQCQQNSLQADFQSINAMIADLNQFQLNQAHCYDLIVTNPPYFASAVACRTTRRQFARYTETLSFTELIASVKRLLSLNGLFCLVLPYHLADQFKMLCESNQLYLHQQMNVNYSADKDYSLSLMAFAFEPTHNVLTQQLCMRDVDGRYSKAFRALLTDFYLFRK